MRKTERFYVTLKDFQDKRHTLTEKYEKDLEGMKRYQGSSGYDQDVRKREKQYQEDLSRLQNEARPELMKIVSEMAERIDKRTMKIPTEEQLRLLQTMKLRENISLEECRRVAETVKDCPLAVSVVNDVARKHGHLYDFNSLCRELSSQRASDLVKGMMKGADDFLQYDTLKVGRIANKHYEITTGVTEPVRRRDLFSDIDGCYSEVCGMDYGTRKQLSEIVDD